VGVLSAWAALAVRPVLNTAARGHTFVLGTHSSVWSPQEDSSRESKPCSLQTSFSLLELSGHRSGSQSGHRFHTEGQV